MKDGRWTQVTPSEYPWEREALAFLKERLPDHDPYRAWANFEFHTDGTISEVDVLVVVPKGVFLVEIKSWPGRLEGDPGTWFWTPPGEVGARPRDNPYGLANRKAKRLKSLLGRQKAFRARRVPFIAPLIFLSDPDVEVRLREDARTGVVGRDATDDGAVSQRRGPPGIIDHLTKLTAEEQRAHGDRRIDRPMAKAIAAALEEAGVRPSARRRQVGDLELRELLEDGPGYQDHVGVHPSFEHVQRRVRIYGTPDLGGPDERARAVRAARREFELLSPIAHPGIVRALAFHEHELGPAIVFERDPNEVRLDHFLAQRQAKLNLYDRLAMVRDLAETVAYAHGRRVFHRALSPRSVLVMPSETPGRRFAIMNWQTGARQGAGTLAATITGTSHVEELVDVDAAPYLAPEAMQPDADPELLDVFSLGAIAFHVFTGRPPAASLAALVEVLQRDGALEVSSVLDGAGTYLTELVREATRADALRRMATVADFLTGLACVEEEITAPEEAEEEKPPLEAQRGDLLGGFRVERRLGRGSTAIAFLVHDANDQRRVLKVALDPDRNDRVRDEGEVLAKLRDRTIIASFAEPLDLSGHVAIVLAYASEGTLARRLHEEGRLGLETLQAWGEDLLSAVGYLEQEGIPHRDIKPENLGIAQVGPNKLRRLVLMDFSLARAPADRIDVGTRPYLDPFLRDARRGRWDVAADRFAAAMVLHEMATGTLPTWGAKGTELLFSDAEATIDADALPREVAGPLAELLRKALRRDVQERFGTADEMLRAWRRAFERLDRPTAHADEQPVDVDALRAAATRETPIAGIGLSARAVDALERIDVLAVADLLALPPIEINRLRGVGLATRRELVDARRALQARLGGAMTTVTADDEAPDVQALDDLVGQLVPRATARTTSQVDGIRLLLALDGGREDASPWPSQTEVAAALSVTRARVTQITVKARERSRRLPSVTRLRDELVTALERLGGVAAVQELERVVAAERGARDELAAPRLARAAVRAAIETEMAREAPRVAVRRAGTRVVVAAAGTDAAQRQRVLDHAVRLGDRADELAAADPLPGAGDVQAALRAVRAPEPLTLTPERLVTLAAAASASTAASARLDLYPRDMPAARAVALARASLLGADGLSPDEIARRVASRFPEAEPLPGRPALDALLTAAGVDLRWDSDLGVYVSPQRLVLTGVTSHVSSEHRLPTATVTRLPSRAHPDVAIASAFEERLLAAIDSGGLLTLMVHPPHVRAAGRELRRLDVTAVDLDALLLRRLHDAADDLNVRWDVVMRADAADPASQDWSRLQTLVARVMPEVERELATIPGTVLLENVGLLARYGHVGLLERLRAQMMDAAPLHGCWVLVPGDEQSDRPSIAGTALPVLTANEVARVPSQWLANRHRSEIEEGVA